MRKLAMWVLAPVLVGALIWGVWPDARPVAGEGLARAASASEVADEGDREAGVRALPTASGVREGAARDEERGLSAAEPGDDAETSALSSLAELRGRLLFAAGVPASGARITLNPRAGAVRMRVDGRLVSSDEHGTSFSDAQGRFSYTIDASAEPRVSLSADLAGYAEVNWSWLQLEAGEVLDLGDTLLRPAGELAVRIVDGAGEPLSPAGWEVSAQEVPEVYVEGYDVVRAGSKQPEDDGSFRLVGLPAGAVELEARSKLAGRARGPRVEVVPATSTAAEIVWRGPDPGRRIVVEVSARPYNRHSSALRDLERVSLLRAGSVVAEGRRQERDAGRYDFEGLDPGLYSVEISDRRFRPWSQAQVEPGSFVRARLVGNAALALEVLDDATGEPVEDYALATRLDRTRSSSEVHAIKALGVAAPAGGLYERLLPWPQTLLLEAPGYAKLEFELPEFAPQETRSLRLRLVRGVRVSGHFRSQLDSRPIADARVMLLPSGSGPQAIPLPPGMSGSRAPARLAVHHEARTDESGRFEFPLVAPGSYALMGVVNRWSVASLDPAIVQAGEGSPELLLIARSAAGITGRVHGPAGVSYEGLFVRVEPEAERLPNYFEEDDGSRLALDSRGEFRGVDLPPGAARLMLFAEPWTMPLGVSGAGLPSAALDMQVARVELVAGEFIDCTLELAERWPGDCEISLSLDGKPAEGLVVELKAEGEFLGVGGALCDARGLARITRVVPGSYHVLVQSPAQRWCWSSESELQVGADPLTRHVLDLTLVQGVVTFLDVADRTPLASWTTNVEAPHHNLSYGRTTDLDGRLQLTLPLGRYRLPLGRLRPDGEDIELLWTANGPSPAEILLVRPRE